MISIERSAAASAVPAVAVAVRSSVGATDVFTGDAREHHRATHATIFEAASLSKPVFALAALQLVASRDLALDRPIAAFVDLRDETDDPRVLRITPRHALTHSTGLPNWRFRPGFLRCAFEPGTRFSYSGEGIFLLQRALERIVGTGLAGHLRREVFIPLGMTSSHFAYDARLESAMAAPHSTGGRAMEWRTLLLGRQLLERARTRDLPLESWRWNDVRQALPTLDPPQRPLPVFATINAASSLLTTAADYAIFAAALPRYPALTRPQIAVTPDIAWGLGIGLERSNSGMAFHWGDNDGFKALFAADAKRSTADVVLTNSDDGMNVALSTMRRLIGPTHAFLAWVGAKYPRAR